MRMAPVFMCADHVGNCGPVGSFSFRNKKTLNACDQHFHFRMEPDPPSEHAAESFLPPPPPLPFELPEELTKSEGDAVAESPLEAVNSLEKQTTHHLAGNLSRLFTWVLNQKVR